MDELDPIATLALFNLAAAAVGTLLALELITRTGRQGAPWRFLGGSLLVGVASVALMVLHATGRIEDYPLLVGVHTPLPFLAGPLIWWFARGLADPASRLRPWDGLHLLPFLLYVWWLWPIYHAPEAVKISRVLASFYADTPGYQRTQVVHMSLLLLHLGVYLAVAGRRLPAGLPAARLALWGYWGIWGVLALRFGFDTFGGWSTSATALVTPTAISTLLLAMGFQAMRGTPRTAALPRYARSGMGQAQARVVADELERLVRERQSYREASFSLADLAALSGFSRHQISQALNDGRGQRFQDFINALRVQDARRQILAARERPNLTRLAAAVGFSSRSTFYAAFRRHAGCAPAELFSPAGSDTAGAP